MKYTFVLLFFSILIKLSMTFPLINKYNTPPDKMLTFMKQYGYLVDDGGQSEALYSGNAISNAIKTVQRFGGLKQTGIIDEATLKLTVAPRCGVPDIIPRHHHQRHKRFAIKNGWNKRHITYFIANWSPYLGENNIATNIQKALDIWAPYGRLKFTRTSSQDADIVVSFGIGYHGDNYPFDGPGKILAHAFFPYDYGEPTLFGDVHFDNDEKWIDLANRIGDGDDGMDFFAVALHELGHSLGLGHSAVQDSIMFPYYKDYDPLNPYIQLHYDDIMGMYQLYIYRQFNETFAGQYPDDNTEATHTDSTDSFTTITTTTTNSAPTTIIIQPLVPVMTDDTTTTIATTQEIDITSTVLYDGDVETVDIHKTYHDSNHHMPPNSSPSLPDLCNTNFDAIANLRTELFLFKDEYTWRLKDKGQLVNGYPMRIHKMFPGLPTDIKKIDAIYQRPNGDIVLFTGKQLWIFNGSIFIENSPLTLTYYNLPIDLNGIDAVQTWRKNSKTYFYKDDIFWRYNETSRTIDEGYPMTIERWRGIPHNLDAAMTWKDGSIDNKCWTCHDCITYFFKGGLYWKFDNEWITITDSSPLPIAPIWLGCNEDDIQQMERFLIDDNDEWNDK